MTKDVSSSAWVTGASGFIGGHVVSSLRAVGVEAISLREALEGGGLVANARACSAQDLLALGTVPQLIVHCGGSTAVRASFDDPVQGLSDTLGQTGELLEFIRRCGALVRFVYMSSSAVYGDTTAPRDETSPIAPVSPYGLHKAMCEDLLRFYGAVHGVTSAVLRPFSVYGAGQRKQLLWDALCRFQRGEHRFDGGADNVRDFIDVRDVAALAVCAAAAASDEVPVFNASTGQGTSVRELLAVLHRLSGSTSSLEFGNAVWPGDPRMLVGLNTRARALGWAPKVALGDGLADVVRWFRGLGPS